MVKVTYHRAYNRLSVSGHANSADKGEDLICAAASILALTLGENVKHMAEINAVRNPVIDIRDGEAEISCTASGGYRNVVANTFQSVIVGFEIMASKFPDNISFEIMG